MLYQQGDVLLLEVLDVPQEAIPVMPTNGRQILAEGEATGHAHVVIDQVELLSLNEKFFCRAEHPFTVVHEEHRPIVVQPGVYEVRLVLEYDHFAEEAKEVRD